MNPFKYGDPVEGEYYLERNSLKKSVLTFIENQINIVLIGPRRYGKTSFIMDLIHTLKADDYNVIFIDVFNVTSHRDFLNQFISNICTKPKRLIFKVLHHLWSHNTFRVTWIVFYIVSDR